jgi:hypothetical protein
VRDAVSFRPLLRREAGGLKLAYGETFMVAAALVMFPMEAVI